MTLQELRVFLQLWFCGCGQPEAAAERLRDLLALHPLYEHRDAFKVLVPDDGLEHLLLYTLEYFDLTEHGGSVGGGWLTDKGKAVLGALNRDTFEVICAQSCIHGYAVETVELDDCPECGTLHAGVRVR